MSQAKNTIFGIPYGQAVFSYLSVKTIMIFYLHWFGNKLLLNPLGLSGLFPFNNSFSSSSNIWATFGLLFFIWLSKCRIACLATVGSLIRAIPWASSFPKFGIGSFANSSCFWASKRLAEVLARRGRRNEQQNFLGINSEGGPNLLPSELSGRKSFNGPTPSSTRSSDADGVGREGDECVEESPKASLAKNPDRFFVVDLTKSSMEEVVRRPNDFFFLSTSDLALESLESLESGRFEGGRV